MIELQPPSRDLPGGAFCGPDTSLSRLHSGTGQVLAVACSDHGRACFEGLDANRILWLQDVANLVAGEPAKATIEYAVSMKGAKDAIVCSHVNCTSLKHLLATDSGELPEAWRGVGEGLHALLRERYSTLPTARQALVTAAEHTLSQVEELIRQPGVQRALNEGSLRIHAWVHCDETDTLFAYDPSSGHFGEASKGS